MVRECKKKDIKRILKILELKGKLFYMKYISIVAKALVNKEPQTWEVIERIKVQK